MESEAFVGPSRRSEESGKHGMSLPPGMTCKECVHFKPTCEWLISCHPLNETCDWSPSKFRPKREPGSNTTRCRIGPTPAKS